jgi:hypothetical protein
MPDPKSDKTLQDMLASISDGADGTYDMEHFYNTVIQPKVAEIFRLCEANDIPYVAAFVYAKEKTGVRLAASNVTGSPAHKCMPLQFLTHLVRDQNALNKVMMLYAMTNVFEDSPAPDQPTNPEGNKDESNP